MKKGVSKFLLILLIFNGLSGVDVDGSTKNSLQNNNSIAPKSQSSPKGIGGTIITTQAGFDAMVILSSLGGLAFFLAGFYFGRKKYTRYQTELALERETAQWNAKTRTEVMKVVDAGWQSAQNQAITLDQAVNNFAETDAGKAYLAYAERNVQNPKWVTRNIQVLTTINVTNEQEEFKSYSIDFGLLLSLKAAKEAHAKSTGELKVEYAKSIQTYETEIASRANIRPKLNDIKLLKKVDLDGIAKFYLATTNEINKTEFKLGGNNVTVEEITIPQIFNFGIGVADKVFMLETSNGFIFTYKNTYSEVLYLQQINGLQIKKIILGSFLTGLDSTFPFEAFPEFVKNAFGENNYFSREDFLFTARALTHAAEGEVGLFNSGGKGAESYSLKEVKAFEGLSKMTVTDLSGNVEIVELTPLQFSLLKAAIKYKGYENKIVSELQLNQFKKFFKSHYSASNENIERLFMLAGGGNFTEVQVEFLRGAVFNFSAQFVFSGTTQGISLEDIIVPEFPLSSDFYGSNVILARDSNGVLRPYKISSEYVVYLRAAITMSGRGSAMKVNNDVLFGQQISGVRVSTPEQISQVNAALTKAKDGEVKNDEIQSTLTGSSEELPKVEQSGKDSEWGFESPEIEIGG